MRVGDTVRVRGEVREFFGLTELGRVEWLKRCPARGGASAAEVVLPLEHAAAWERVEGMRVRIAQPLVASGAEDLGRFGEVVLAAGERLWQPTQRAAPGDPARAWHERNLRHRVLLDDGRHASWPDPPPYLETAQGSALRLGDRVCEVEGVIDFAFGSFRIHPTLPVRFASAAARPEPPRAQRGALRIAAWNVENFFNGDGAGGGFPTRGAASAVEFERQRAKILAALAAVDADVFALAELENDGVAAGSAARELADRAVRSGSPRRSRSSIPERTGSASRRSRSACSTAATASHRSERPRCSTRARVSASTRAAIGRASRAASVHLATGERITVAVNHWKSKGSPCDSAGDPDLGDGQGNCNRTRTRAAQALAAWLAGDPTRAGGAPALIVGDLNAYPNEDPLSALAAAGFVDLLAPIRRARQPTATCSTERPAGSTTRSRAPRSRRSCTAPRSGTPTPTSRRSSTIAPRIRRSRSSPIPIARPTTIPCSSTCFRTATEMAGPTRATRARKRSSGRRWSGTAATRACPSRSTRPDAAWATGSARSPRLPPTAARAVSALRRALIDYFADGTLSPRECVAILACGRRIASR